MFGEDKESEEIFLEDSDTHRNKFERNHMDRFSSEYKTKRTTSKA